MFGNGYKELRAFKDQWAQKRGYEGWHDYKDHCESHGFSEDEVGYDQLMLDYGKMIENKYKSNTDNTDYDAGIFASHIQND